MPFPLSSGARDKDEITVAMLYYKKLHEESSHHPSFGWIFHFVDIIFVATVYTIGQLFEQCGINYKVFFIAAAYFGIMFTTRMFFDAYAFTFIIEAHKNEIPRIVIFILYCLGVYNMTLNIAFDTTSEDSSEADHYGTCKRNVAYDNGFALAFIGTRLLIICLYVYHWIALHEKVEKDFGAFFRLLLKKTIPSVLSILAMSVIFLGVPVVAVFSAVAALEIVSDIIGEYCANLPDHLLPNVGLFQERLGLIFMLVLGETMVGLLFQSYNDTRQERTYGTVVSAFFIVSSIGMQFFERAQSNPHHIDDHIVPDVDDNGRKDKFSLDLTREESITNAVAIALAATQSGHTNPLHLSHSRPQSVEEAPTLNSSSRQASRDVHGNPLDATYSHPLLHKNKGFYSAYVWLHALISFFMLLATSSIVTIYYDVAGLHTTDDHADDHSTSSEYHHYNYQLEKAKVTGGLVMMWTFMLFMEVLQPRYRKMLRAPLPENWTAFWKIFTDKNKRNKEILYSKLIFILKLIVIALHIMYYFFSPSDSSKGNYFVGGTAVIASLPSLLDIVKLFIEFFYRLPDTLEKFSRRESMNTRDSLTSAQIESARKAHTSIEAPFSQRLSGLNEALLLSEQGANSTK